MIKVVHVINHQSSGGASVAALRLHHILNQNNIDSNVLYLIKGKNVEKSFGPNKYLNKIIALVFPKIEEIIIKLLYPKLKSLISFNFFSGLRLKDYSILQDVDILHIHWIGQSTISLASLNKISKPVVITLHDMWALTGGCHYNNNCIEINNQCKKCPLIDSNNVSLTNYCYNIKRKIYKNKNITFIAPSKWLFQLSKNSSLNISSKVVNIPNIYDPKQFITIDKFEARKLLNLPLNKKLILISSFGDVADIRKGTEIIIKLLPMIDPDIFSIVTLGPEVNNKNILTDLQVFNIGMLTDQQAINLVYNAVDVFVLPSLQENFSNIVIESMFCKTPVVAFKIGGNIDIIEHKVTGYIAQPFDVIDFLNGILFCSDDYNLDLLSNEARKSVFSKYSDKNLIDKYINLYDKILKNNIY